MDRSAAMGSNLTRSGPLLSNEGLSLSAGSISLVDQVSLAVEPGQILALVGESGCGKSLTALSVLGLLPQVIRRTAGRIVLDGQELSAMGENGLRDIRGRLASFIFQEPVASLNPLMRVGEQVAEALRIHQGLRGRAAEAAALEMLARVGIPDPAVRARQYPFELSGGMCQRVMIASALIARPLLLIADEPTTALDVTIQAQILDLIKTLRAEVGSAVILITHDMGVVAEMADRVAVMYGGRVIEEGEVQHIFEAPAHPYTRLLLATIPRLDGEPGQTLPTIEGRVPAADEWPPGCRFSPRCPNAMAQCTVRPELKALSEFSPDHKVACWWVSPRSGVEP